MEKECLDIKWSLEMLRYYLLGREFDLETDHRALTWFQTMKDHNSRVMRWYLSLQPYKFKVRQTRILSHAFCLIYVLTYHFHGHSLHLQTSWWFLHYHSVLNISQLILTTWLLNYCYIKSMSPCNCAICLLLGMRF